MVQEIRKNPIVFLGFGLLSLVMITAVVVASQSPVHDPLQSPNHRIMLDPGSLEPRGLEASTSRALDLAFETEQYDWPPSGQQTIPPLVLTKLPDDLAALQNPRKRQELFLRALLPIILIENRRISEQRELAKLLLEGEQPVEGSPMHGWLKKLAGKLRIRGDLKDPEVVVRLLSRLDEIPPALALAQSAIETGWGTSRFAREGNSLFGQWTFMRTGGLKPSERDADATHLVASFPNLRASIRAYMRNLNTGHAYSEFRQARAELRAEDKPLQAEKLAAYLQRYSQRGEQYVADLQHMIKSRRISSLANASLGQADRKMVVATLDSENIIK